MTSLQKTETPLAGGVRAKLDSTVDNPILAAEEQACNGQVADWRSRKALWIPHAQFTLKNRPARTYEAKTLGEVFEIVAAGRPTRAAKGASPGLIPSAYHAHDAREKAAQLLHGNFVALWVDIDKGSPPGARVLRAVKGLVGGSAFAIWSTASATEEAPRWRVLVPLADPVDPQEWLILQTAMSRGLKEAGIETDDSADRIHQLLYLPNIPPESWQDGVPLFFEIKVNNVPQAWQQGLGNLDQHVEAARRQAAFQAAEAIAKREAAQRRRAELAAAGGGETPIQRALAHLGDVVEVALEHGYELDPSDPTNLRSPLQTTGSYASRVQPDGDALFSLSGSDAEAGLGIAANGGRLVDALDIVAFFDHGNDRKAALAAVLAKADASDPAQDFSVVAPGELDDIAQALLQHGSESHAALAFVHGARNRMVFCAKTGGWLEWTGTHWKTDESRKAFHFAVLHGRRSAAMRGPQARTELKASWATGVEKIASADPALARTVDQFDQHPELLATPAGVIDLRRGVLMPADPEYLITRCAGAAPEGGKPARWLEFLRWVFDGDEDRIDWLQSWLGYCLTGRIGLEQALYLDGPGGNGKGVIAQAMRVVLGQYFQQAPYDLLQYSPMPQHPTSLAALRGARLVVCSELPVGMRLDERRFKGLTGGDVIRARFMHRDEFEFTPTFKLVIASNHRPHLAEPDEAMRRRLRVVSMTKVAANPDPTLKSTVIPAEAGRILSWLMEGAQRVLASSEMLPDPARIAADTDAYLTGQDPVARFLMERCIRDSEAPAIRQSALYNEFAPWASAEGYSVRRKDFHDRVGRQGIAAGNTGGSATYRGLLIRPRGVDESSEFLA